MALKKQHKARWNCNMGSVYSSIKQSCVITYAHCLIPARQRNMAYSSKWEMTVFEIQTRDVHILPPAPPTHTCPTLWQTYAWLCLISHCIFCSLFLYFCTEFSWQYNAMRKFVRALDNPPPHPRADLSSLTIRHKHLTVNRFTSQWNTLIHFIFFHFCLVKSIFRCKFCTNPQF